jgi:predicted transcriptional regulator
MREAGFLDANSMGTVADVLRSMSGKAHDVMMIQQNQKVSSVIELMREKSISQLPVTDAAGWIKGIVTESGLLAALYEGKIKTADTIEALVMPAVEFVTPSDPVEKVSRLVTAGKIPLVNDPSQQGKILGIITKIDLLTFMGNRT